MTTRLLIAVVALAGMFESSAALLTAQGRPRDVLYQVSTLDALSNGDYDGRMPFRSLESHGDFGLGTFDRLDGELVVLDGRYFRIRADGSPVPVQPTETTPFAVVTRFESDESFRITGEASCQTLLTAIEQRLPSRDLPYAIRLAGSFSMLQTRSVPAQSPPYRPLAEALRDQVVFMLEDVDATMVGFWLPQVLQNVNASGFHFHAITSDHHAGGHVLDCESVDLTVDIDATGESRILFADSLMIRGH
jgi:acetolactate decarboxylase